eukprot:422528_1
MRAASNAACIYLCKKTWCPLCTVYGRSFPVYEGIVVACENATKVIEHYFVAESTRRKRAEQKRASAVLGRWVRLVKGALERTRILEENRLPEERLSQIPSSSPSLGSSQIS